MLPGRRLADGRLLRLAGELPAWVSSRQDRELRAAVTCGCCAVAGAAAQSACTVPSSAAPGDSALLSSVIPRRSDRQLAS